MAYGNYLSLIRRKKSLGLPITQQEASLLAEPALKTEAMANVESAYRSRALDLQNRELAGREKYQEGLLSLQKEEQEARSKLSLMDIASTAKLGSDIYSSPAGQGLLKGAGLIKTTPAYGAASDVPQLAVNYGAGGTAPTGATGLIEAGGTGAGATGATGAGTAATVAPTAAEYTAGAGAIEAGEAGSASAVASTSATTSTGMAALKGAGVGAAAGFVSGTVARMITKAGQPGHEGGERITGGVIGGVAGFGFGWLAGAAYGSAFGPIGTVVGAVVGLIVGALTGSGSSVICTELNRQGYLSDEILELDTIYGMINIDHETYAGYRKLADPIVRLMQRSKFVTKWLVRPIALAWCFETASQIAPELYKGNFIGKFIMKIGIPICRWLGKKKVEVAYGVN